MTTHATEFRLARWTGVAIGIAVLSVAMSVVVLLILVGIVHDADARKAETCNMIEDVIRETLIPLDPPENATPEQLRSYANANANAQKLHRLDQITKAVRDGSGCRVSVQVRQ